MMERKQLYHLQREDSNTSTSTSDIFAPNEERKPVRKLITPSSSLEIVEGDQFGASGMDRSPSEASFRSWSRSSVGSVPPRSDSSLSRRTLTPTKQISLQAVRRREESSEPFVDHIDVESARLESNNNRKVCWDFSNQDDDVDFSRLSIGDHSRRNHGNSRLVNGDNVHALSNGETSQGKSHDFSGQSNKVAPNSKTKDNKDSSSEDDDDDDDEDDDEKRKAPNELLMEFVDCLMKKDFSNANKLCKMILLYEPENEEALKFKPLIEEKMQLDAEAAAAEEEDGSSDEDDDDDDDDDSDDDSDEDSSSDDGDDDSEEDDEDKDIDSADVKVPEAPSDNKIIGANTSRVWKPVS